MFVWVGSLYVVAPWVRGGTAEMTREANEASAALTVREIGLAELEHNVAYPETGFACSLEELRLPEDMAGGYRRGYVFTVADCEVREVNGREIHTGYRITAVTEEVGRTGRRGFCADEERAVTVDPAGGVNCGVGCGRGSA